MSISRVNIYKNLHNMGGQPHPITLDNGNKEVYEGNHTRSHKIMAI